MQQPYTPPTFKGKGFHCPLCLTYAKQSWGNAAIQYTAASGGSVKGLGIEYVGLATCSACDKESIWVNGKMVYPQINIAPVAHPDMSEDVRRDYDEARNIVGGSARGAAALLRLCIQKIAKEIGGDGKNINNDIKTLVANGLSPLIQQSLDIVRVIGNDSVHPGQIDISDDLETTTALFNLVNLIVEEMIARPKAIAALYNSLPEDKRRHIDERDGKK